MQIVWERLKHYTQNDLDLSSLTSQSAILGFTESRSENFIIINHLLLIFKNYIFKSRSNNRLSFLQLKTDIIKVKTFEEDLSNPDKKQTNKKDHKKWQRISDILSYEQG